MKLVRKVHAAVERSANFLTFTSNEGYLFNEVVSVYLYFRTSDTNSGEFFSEK